MHRYPSSESVVHNQLHAGEMIPRGECARAVQCYSCDGHRTERVILKWAFQNLYVSTLAFGPD